MKATWVDKGHTMGKHRCVTLNAEGNEHCLVGELGEIWEDTQGMYKAFKVSPSGDEKIFTFKSKDLWNWVLKLKVPPKPDDQLRYANNPNIRHEILKLKQGYVLVKKDKYHE